MFGQFGIINGDAHHTPAIQHIWNLESGISNQVRAAFIERREAVGVVLALIE
jgi:hypothetical protein